LNSLTYEIHVAAIRRQRHFAEGKTASNGELRFFWIKTSFTVYDKINNNNNNNNNTFIN